MTDTCAACGLAVEGGTAGCQALFEAEGARQAMDAHLARWHRLTVDLYALQHPERYCASAISLAAHLSGLCAWIDHPTHPGLLRDLQRWLDDRPALAKPVLPGRGERGSLTIGHVVGVDDADAYARAMEAWARQTWTAYAALQPLARRWVADVLR